MKNKKTFFKVLVGLLSIAIFGMVIAGCNGSNNDKDEVLGGDTEVISTQNTENSENRTEQDSERNTEAVTETVEGTEEVETTEETETTENIGMELPDEAGSSLKTEEEEILVITPTDDDVNNGSGNNEKEVYTAPAAASSTNPIVKVATGETPITFSSGKIPAGEVFYYKLSAKTGNYICIADSDAYIVYDDKQYKANAEGKVMFEIKEDVSLLAIGNKAKSAKAFEVSVETPPLGSSGNPYVIETLPDDGVVVSNPVTADSAHYYKISGVSEMVLTIEDSTAYVVYKGTKYTADESGVVTVKMGKLEGAATIQLGNSSKTEEKTYNMNFAYPVGSEQNPMELALDVITGGVEGEVEVPAGETVYYHSNIIGGTELVIEDVTANVIYKGQTYAAEEAATAVLVQIEAATNNKEPISFAVKNTGTSDAKYKLVFTYPEGSYNNPIVISEAGSYSHEFAEGDSAYYYQWTAPASGTMTFAVSDATSCGWQYSISNELKNIADGPYDSGMENVASKEYEVSEGDVFILKIVTYEEEATAPAGTVEFTLNFTEAVDVADLAIGEAIVPEITTEIIESEETTEDTETDEDTEVSENTEKSEEAEVTEETEITEDTEIPESTEDTESTEM